jgi:hypothetical protein
LKGMVSNVNFAVVVARLQTTSWKSITLYGEDGVAQTDRII